MEQASIGIARGASTGGYAQEMDRSTKPVSPVVRVADQAETSRSVLAQAKELANRLAGPVPEEIGSPKGSPDMATSAADSLHSSATELAANLNRISQELNRISNVF